jgi:hypothetical protein
LRELAPVTGDPSLRGRVGVVAVGPRVASSAPMLHDLASHLSLRVCALLGGAALLLLPGCPGDAPIEDDGSSSCNTGTCGDPTTTSQPPLESTADGTTGPGPATGTSSEGTTGPGPATGTSSEGTTELGTSSSDGTTGDSSSSGTTEGVSVGSTSTDDGVESGVVFIVDPDFGNGMDCDPWLQDCPAGQKCNPWSNDGGSSWNANACFPIDPMAVGVGQACTVQGSGTSGIDDCALGSMCWGVDTETNLGTCVALCTGSPFAPVCAAGTSCVITNGGVITLCLPGCDPLLQDCAANEGCYLVNDDFICAPDASGVGGFDGDPCEFINVCAPGLMCVSASAVEGCFFGFAGCCTPYCDLTLPGDPCPAALEVCVPVYDVGMAPPGYEDVGVCSIP